MSIPAELDAKFDKATGKQVVRFSWRAFEVSSVPIPADETVGVGRSKRLDYAPGEDPQHPIKCDCGYTFTADDLEADKCPECGEQITAGRTPAPDDVEAWCEECDWSGTWRDAPNNKCPRCGQ